MERELGAGGMATVYLAINRAVNEISELVLVLNWFDELRARR
jgi:hypothetical protein